MNSPHFLIRKSSSYRLPFVQAAMLVLLPFSLHAQRVWNTGNGNWETPANWTGGMPSNTTTGHQALFQVDGASSQAEIKVTIGSGIAAKAARLEVGAGKKVLLKMESGSSLVTGSLWGIGANIGTGTGSGSLVIEGPESGLATISSGYFYVGRSDIAGGSHTFTLTGGVVMTDMGTSISTVGRFQDHNLLAITGGASMTRYSMALSPNNADAGRIGNRVVVSGAKSRLILDGGGMTIGNVATARSNSTKIEAGGEMEVRQAKGIVIGHSNSYGGNYLEISGTLKTEGTVQIYGYSLNGGDNDGANRLTVASGGKLFSSGAIASAGLLQLAAGGTLEGRNLAEGAAPLAVSVSGRFEAEGTGLAANVSTAIENGGTMAIGLEENVATLLLSGVLHLQSGSTLELHLGGSSAVSTIDLDATGSIVLGENVSLALTGSYQPVAGDRWTLFTGNTGAIAGGFAFDPGDWDPLVWDLSRLNEAGGWEIAVIPESSTLTLWMMGLAVIGYAGLSGRRKHSATL